MCSATATAEYPGVLGLYAQAGGSGKVDVVRADPQNRDHFQILEGLYDGLIKLGVRPDVDGHFSPLQPPDQLLLGGSFFR